MKKTYNSRLKKRLKCSNCTKKLNNSVFQVCICKKLFCPSCVPKKTHSCMHHNPPTPTVTPTNTPPLSPQKKNTMLLQSLNQTLPKTHLSTNTIALP